MIVSLQFGYYYISNKYCTINFVGFIGNKDCFYVHSLASIIIPTYNSEQYITETLESVLTQAYQPIEVMVVDDRSTDET